MKYEVLQTTLIFFNNGSYATLYIDFPGVTGDFFPGEKGMFIDSTLK